MNLFGKLLRKRREEANKTMGDLADFLGLSVPYLSDVERGRRAPFHPDRLHKISQFLKIDFDELYEAALKSREAFELDAVNVTSQAREVGAALMRGWADLTPEQLQKIAKVIEKQS